MIPVSQRCEVRVHNEVLRTPGMTELLRPAFLAACAKDFIVCATRSKRSSGVPPTLTPGMPPARFTGDDVSSSLGAKRLIGFPSASEGYRPEVLLFGAANGAATKFNRRNRK